MDLTVYDWETDLKADEKVNLYILKLTKEDRNVHTCEETTVIHLVGSDGEYGCDTGCEYARLEAYLVCPHNPEGIKFEYGEFGNLNDILEDIAEGG